MSNKTYDDYMHLRNLEKAWLEDRATGTELLEALLNVTPAAVKEVVQIMQADTVEFLRAELKAWPDTPHGWHSFRPIVTGSSIQCLSSSDTSTSSKRATLRLKAIVEAYRKELARH